MFKANVVDINENLENKINNPIYIDMDNIEDKKLNEHINPWSDIRDYISSSCADKITKYVLDIPDKDKERFFARYYNKIGLEFLVIPENLLMKVGNHNSLNNLIKQQNFPFIRSKNFYKKLDKVKLDEKGIKNYRYTNGDVKYLVVKTLSGHHFISKQDIDRFTEKPTDFLLIIKPFYKKGNYMVNKLSHNGN